MGKCLGDFCSNKKVLLFVNGEICENKSTEETVILYSVYRAETYIVEKLKIDQGDLTNIICRALLMSSCAGLMKDRANTQIKFVSKLSFTGSREKIIKT